MIIAFSGNDGSGKTTLCLEIKSALEKKGFSVEYRHEYNYLILKKVFALLGERLVENRRSKFLKKEVNKKKGLDQFLWPFIVWFDNLFAYFYYKFSYRNKIIILDRYPYDMYLSFLYLGVNSKIQKFFFYHFPKADVNLILYAKPEVAYKRKKATHTYSLDFYQTQLKRYKLLAKSLNIEMYETKGSVVETRDELLQRILPVIEIKGTRKPL